MNNESICVLVLEASTTSAKAMIVNGAGQILAQKMLPLGREVGDVSLQDVKKVFAKICEAGRAVSTGYPIAAIGLVGIWHSLFLAVDHEPIMPAMTWANTDAMEIANQFREDPDRTESIHHTAGCIPHASYPLYKLIYLRSKDTAQRTPYTGLQNLDWTHVQASGIGDYLFYRLTGVFGTSLNMASGMSLLNNQTLNWDAELLQLAGISQQQLPRLYHHTTTFPLSETAAEALGILPGIPVALPFADGCMNQLGADAMRPGIMTLSVGTSCAIRTIQDRPIELPTKSGLWCYHALDNYLVGAATAGGTNCIDWFIEVFAPEQSAKTLDTLVADTVPSPIFLPFIYGERSPGWQAGRRGGFYCDGQFFDSRSLENPETKQDLLSRFGLAGLYRGVLEGILMTLYQNFAALIEFAEIKVINLSGGILYSPVWKKMVVDLFQRPMQLPDSEQASTLGGAKVALQAIGKLALKETIAMEADSISPDTSRAAYYQNKYQIYLDAYQLTSQRSLTGTI